MLFWRIPKADLHKRNHQDALVVAIGTTTFCRRSQLS